VAAGTEFLSHVGERPVADKARLHRASRRTKRIKQTVMGVVVVLVMLMVIWPLTNMGKRGFKVNLASNVAQNQGEQPHMQKPQLHGLDNQGQPYTITSSDAVQEDTENVILQDIEGDIALNNEGWITLRSDTGHYNLTNQTLQLLGAVNVLTDRGFEFETETAFITLKTKEVQGDTQVELQGAPGTITANSFAMDGLSNHIIFKGNVHLRAFPPKKH
jgi:lipopolysaccharide export system protein LptC